ncbi:peptidylprolyl isomerase [uncultured Brevundimonas sp.]|uniref:peptidylprolyl isomerase n=1 Tax=uncultured Brevundimonas sp. TaxID=213418 RepID=UPI0030EF870F|tara:strand:- start:1072 stop:1701 length:630 start_codon:yes stop_codon:yes gene_type:complete
MQRRPSLVAVAAGLGLSACVPTLNMTDQRVDLETPQGTIGVAVNVRAAPLSACNFLRYADAGDYDGGSVFRTVIRETNTASPHPIDVIQAATPRGSDDDAHAPIPLERTRDTGLRHVAGAVSLARDGPDTATSSFFIVTRDTPDLDYGGGRNPDGQGFAVFGRVVHGLDVARRIQHLPADGDELLTPPVPITRARLHYPLPVRCRGNPW